MSLLEMEPIICDKSQFDISGGTLSCTAAALLWGRYCLEKIPKKNDMNRILDAGVELYTKWRKTSKNSMPCWKELIRIYPAMFSKIGLVYETNGVIGGQPDLELKEWLIVTLEEALEYLCQENHPRSILLTVGNASYGMNYDGSKNIHFFDSHGSIKTRGNAYMLRFTQEDDLKTFVQNNFIEDSEFTMLVYESSSSSP